MSHWFDRWTTNIMSAIRDIRINRRIAKYPLLFRGYSVKLIGTPNDAILTKADNDNDRFPVNQG